MAILWVKAFHIICIVCWFAGLFYMPRLFVYHAKALDAKDTTVSETLKVMERRLYYAITMPAMVFTWISGLFLLAHFWPAYHLMGWLHAKLTLVVLLTIYHFSMGMFYKKFRDDKNTKTHRFFRYYNEIPTVFLISIVILVVVKPF